ncbi:MAG: ABC transporter ATP-binding protein [Reyranella sp.]|jgi:ATP-binding cassette subfamily B protein|uniref:ABC transporter ATP-binding protein n=1 Tax=Reyranella sp. TaxID=1929291 RepID=UPI0025D17D07|nr:ABC transporter ATP-binding protein [Reyranella sp.]MBR2815114.1 ABC transporter ATP-binding protein [Reyranella sp.]
MEDLSKLAGRPFAFLFRYVVRRPMAHAAILLAVVGAAACAVSTQYGVKSLIDALSGGQHAAVWVAFALLVSLMAADNFLWRVAGWIASYAFVATSGELRRELFRHITDHAPSFFTQRQAGTVTGRVTATANAAFTIENMFIWNVLPPCVATLGAIAFLITVDPLMTGSLVAVAAVLLYGLYRLAVAGSPLHMGFANKAAGVEGELTDVVSNIMLVRSFGAVRRERRRFRQTVGEEMAARRTSLLYLEKVRFLHAATTIVLTIGLLAWAIMLWQRGAVTSGQVVLVCTLGLTILYATRDLAVALVDVTQHTARLSEALTTLLQPHDLKDRENAQPLAGRCRTVTFENVTFAYADGHRVFDKFSVEFRPGQRTGLVGPSGGGKSTLFALLQRFHDLDRGRILIDGQDIAHATQTSLRDVISLVPQDISLLHRSVMDNIRYGRPDASDEDVRRAAEAARCHQFIEALPQGFDTIVGERGTRLSAGQRQRIAIARALLKDTPILLLDEATSSLDGESEEAIRQALDQLMQNRTVIAIAHRLSTLRSFDRILVLEGGHVAQDGAPTELLHRDGPYRTLVWQELDRLSRSAA